MSALAPTPNLDSYDRILVATSGGKNSMAAMLAVLDAGADPSRIELHHHLVDGRGPAIMDWSSTEGWCRAVAAAFRLPCTCPGGTAASWASCCARTGRPARCASRGQAGTPPDAPAAGPGSA